MLLFADICFLVGTYECTDENIIVVVIKNIHNILLNQTDNNQTVIYSKQSVRELEAATS